MGRALRGRWLPAVLLLLATVMPVATGCTRRMVMNLRLASIGDPRARAVAYDVRWRHCGENCWSDHETLQVEVTRIEHRPAGDATSDETWLVDLWSPRLRLERPASGEVVVFDGIAIGVFRDGRPTTDLAARAAAAGDARLLRELLLLPIAPAAPGRRVTYGGLRTGPAGARAWHRLVMTYTGQTGHAAGDQTIVEVRQDTGRVEAAVLTWSGEPLLGRPTRVALDDWRPVDGLLVSRRWRLSAADESGAAAGPPEVTVKIRRADLDVRVDEAAFRRP